jgi:hypothetical protein
MPIVPSELRIPVATVSIPVRRAAPVIRRQWLFAWWMGIAAVIAATAGLTLGVLAAMEEGIGATDWTPVVQAHGRLQLFGFAATFVTALVLEFVPRLNQRMAFPVPLRLGIPASFAAGSAMVAASQAWHGSAEALGWPGSALIAAGAIAFAVTLWRVAPPMPLRVSPQPLFLRAAAAWLAVSAALSAWATAETEFGVVPLDLSRTTVETFLRGFVLLTIMGIGLRAFVGHLGLEPMSARRQGLLLGGLNVSLVAWVAGQGLGAMPELSWLARAGDLGLAATVLVATAWFGLFPRLWRGPRAHTYELIVPVAWVGLVVYAVILAVVAVIASPSGRSLYEDGALRHTFMLGFMVPLMVAMAHIVLARFGTGAVPWERTLTAAFWVIMAAAPLRVAPALFVDSPTDLGQSAMGLAGVLAMVGLALVAAVCAKTALLIVSRHRAAAGALPMHRAVGR